MAAPKNPRKPNAVLALIAKHTKGSTPTPGTRQANAQGQLIPSASLWSRIRLRKQK